MSEITKKAASEMLEELAQQIFVNEAKIYTAAGLKNRFADAANRHRQDQTIQQVSRVVCAMADKQPHRELTAQDIESLMNQFLTSDTSFREEFSDLIDSTQPDVQASGQAPRMEYHGDYRELDEVKHAAAEVDINDQDSDIEALVDPSLTYSRLDVPSIRYAASLVDEELKRTNRIGASDLKLKYKTPDLLMYQAKFKTASGEATAYIPVELRDGNPLIPQVMTTNERVYSLDTSGVDHLTQDIAEDQYIKEAQAADKLRVDLGMSDDVRNDNFGTVEVDEFEELPQKEVHLGIDEIESVLKDAVVRKESKYASDDIAYGRDLVAIELNDQGFRSPQVSFAGDGESGPLYDAVVNTEFGKFQIQVPVHSSKGMLLQPQKFAHNGKEYDLTRTGVAQAAREGHPEEEIHPFLYNMSYPDLKKHLKTAAHQHKPKLAKQIISLIAEKWDPHYQNAAIDDYQTWLEEASESYSSRCGGCGYYNEKTAQSADWCNLIKTATKDVIKDDESGICTRSVFAEVEEEEEDDKISLDLGTSIKL